MDNNKAVEKALALFSYIKEIVSLKYRVVTNIKDQLWSRSLSDLPEDKYVRFDPELTLVDSDNNLVLLSVKKPSDSEYKDCPQPDESFIEWLKPGWDNYKKSADYYEVLPQDNESDNDEALDINTEYFTDDQKRLDAYEKWIEEREVWADEQSRLNAVRSLFMELYSRYSELLIDSETRELMIGNGELSTSDDKSINHPLLLKRVMIQFDAKENIISIIDADTEPEIYSVLLQNVEDINTDIVKVKED